MNQESILSIKQAVARYIDQVSLARSPNTARTYSNALHAFLPVLSDHGIDPETTRISNLSEDAVAWFASFLKNHSPSTERLYMTALAGFYHFIAAEEIASPNLTRVQLLIKQRTRRPGVRLPQFPERLIAIVINYANNLTLCAANDEASLLRNLRDRALMLTLADTGLRVHEACALRRGDIDWNEGKAVIIGKGDQQAVVRFSSRVLQSMRDYLTRRAALDGASGKPLASLPLFSRHDRGAGKKIKPITTATARNIISQRVREAIGDQGDDNITPHSFRHYFVTTVLKASGNLKMAQELARHRNIAVTQRYAHLSDDELDQGYYEIFEK